MNLKFSRVLGVVMIIFSWVLWGIIFILPFFRLTLAQYAIVYPSILAATNVFWIGIALAGKELVQKLRVRWKLKK